MTVVESGSMVVENRISKITGGLIKGEAVRTL